MRIHEVFFDQAAILPVIYHDPDTMLLDGDFDGLETVEESQVLVENAGNLGLLI